MPASDLTTVIQRQQAFGYTYEQLRKILGRWRRDAVEPVGAMGNDTPLAVLSDVPQLLYSYFRQLFAQVTNPPIDAIREEIVTDTGVMMGTELNLLETLPENCRQIRIETPVLTNEGPGQDSPSGSRVFPLQTFPILFEPNEGRAGWKRRWRELFADVDTAIDDGVNISWCCRIGALDPDRAAIPALLAVSGLHHHLIRTGKRTQVTLILESGEPREVHHFAVLIGYGASAINPYLGYETLEVMAGGMLGDTNVETAHLQVSQGADQGCREDMLEDGYLDHSELLWRTDLRGAGFEASPLWTTTSPGRRRVSRASVWRRWRRRRSAAIARHTRSVRTTASCCQRRRIPVAA